MVLTYGSKGHNTDQCILFHLLSSWYPLLAPKAALLAEIPSSRLHFLPSSIWLRTCSQLLTPPSLIPYILINHQVLLNLKLFMPTLIQTLFEDLCLSHCYYSRGHCNRHMLELPHPSTLLTLHLLHCLPIVRFLMHTRIFMIPPSCLESQWLSIILREKFKILNIAPSESHIQTQKFPQCFEPLNCER